MAERKKDKGERREEALRPDPHLGYDRVMGSTCQSLVRLAPCDVMVVK